MATIKVNGAVNALVHKGGSWLSIATLPDVCKTPTPGGPVPIPYPNISQASTLSGGTTTVKVDGGNMAAIKGSKFAISSGDEPGVAGGIKSGTFKRASTWILYSFDVKLDGKNACRFSDKKFQNNENTVDAAGVLPLVVRVALDEIKMKCGELGQYGPQTRNTSAKGKRDRDHIPSKGALKERARMLKDPQGDAELSRCEERVIDNAALTIVIPKKAHIDVSPTYGQSTAAAQADAGNLQKSARRDTRAMLNKNTGISQYDPNCEKAYRKAATKINRITNQQYDAWLRKIIKQCNKP